MNYTLADFLNSGIVPEIKQHTKAMDFSLIPVQSSSVQELPVENLNFIQPDEIVLSTGAGSDSDPGCLFRLIEGAGRAHAAAIIFSLKDETFLFPDETIAYADSISLPVFTIPWRYRFSPIQTALTDAVREKELSVFREIQNSLFNAFFDGQSLISAAGHISSVFECPVEITDTSGSCLAKAMSPAALRLASGDFVFPDGACPCLNIPVRIGEDCFGLLRLPADQASIPLSEKTDILEKYVAFPLSLWFNRKKIEEMTASRLKNDFVWNLAAGNYSSFEEMARQGRYLGFDLEKPYTCLVAEIESDDAFPGPGYSSAAVRNAEKIEEIFSSEGRRQKLSIMAAGLSTKFILFAENPDSRPESAIRTFVDAAAERLKEEFPSVRCFWGISESLNEKADFERLYKNASLALQYCLNEKDKRTCFTYKDTKKALIVSALAEHTGIRENAMEALGKLLEYDKTSDMGLLKTLTEFIRCGCNTSRTARNLHIHRQSLLYRLEKIETLTNMSLSEHDDIFLLEIYSRIFASY